MSQFTKKVSLLVLGVLAVAIAPLANAADPIGSEDVWEYASTVTLTPSQIEVVDKYAVEVEGNTASAHVIDNAIARLDAYLSNSGANPLSGDLAEFNNPQLAQFLRSQLMTFKSGNVDVGFANFVPAFSSDSTVESLVALANEINKIQKELDADDSKLTDKDRATKVAEVAAKGNQLGVQVRQALVQAFSRESAYETISARSNFVRQLLPRWKAYELSGVTYDLLRPVSIALAEGSQGLQSLLSEVAGAFTNVKAQVAHTDMSPGKVSGLLGLHSQISALLTINPVEGVTAMKANADDMVYGSLVLAMALSSSQDADMRAMGADLVDQAVTLVSRVKTRLGYFQKFPGSYGDNGVSSTRIAQTLVGAILISNNLYNAAEHSNYVVRGEWAVTSDGKAAFREALINSLRVALIDEAGNASAYAVALAEGPMYRRHYSSEPLEAGSEKVCEKAVRIKSILKGGTPVSEIKASLGKKCASVNADKVAQDLATDREGYVQFFKGDVPNAVIDTNALDASGIAYVTTSDENKDYETVQTAYFSSINYIHGDPAEAQTRNCLDDVNFATPTDKSADLMVKSCRLDVSGMDLYDENKAGQIDRLFATPFQLALRFAKKHAPGQVDGLATDYVQGVSELLPGDVKTQCDLAVSFSSPSVVAEQLADQYGKLVAVAINELGQLHADTRNNSLLWPMYSAPTALSPSDNANEVLKARADKFVQTTSLIAQSIVRGLAENSLPLGIDQSVRNSLDALFQEGSALRRAGQNAGYLAAYEAPSFVGGASSQVTASTQAVSDRFADEGDEVQALGSSTTAPKDLFFARAGTSFGIEAFRMLFEVPTGLVDEVVVDSQTGEKAYRSRLTNQELVDAIKAEATRSRSTYVNAPAL